ncbi:hypothetical protein PPACK8108_LOCUS6612 [Phakopsora pachyrhizi]|uniref:Uncharacterized protein n=1 Tax=Phakopsora pachyrhizi TaxID=170000 RepID=A0AAV0ATB3_PHAPC|nr:hypothetical protein PPACK8108_LOCUS6612 [Phakopsora pachyrhizi]
MEEKPEIKLKSKIDWQIKGGLARNAGQWGRQGQPGLGSSLQGWVLGREGRAWLGFAGLGPRQVAVREGRAGLGSALLGWVLGRWQARQGRWGRQGQPGLGLALLGWVLGRWQSGRAGAAGARLGFARLGPRQVAVQLKRRIMCVTWLSGERQRLTRDEYSMGVMRYAVDNLNADSPYVYGQPRLVSSPGTLVIRILEANGLKLPNGVELPERIQHALATALGLVVRTGQTIGQAFIVNRSGGYPVSRMILTWVDDPNQLFTDHPLNPFQLRSSWMRLEISDSSKQYLKHFSLSISGSWAVWQARAGQVSRQAGFAGKVGLAWARLGFAGLGPRQVGRQGTWGRYLKPTNLLPAP